MLTTLEEALKTLRAAEQDLRAKGIEHAGVFGSTARGEAGPESDIDILIDFDPELPITIYDYVGVREDIARLFNRSVDVIEGAALKPGIQASVRRDLVYAF